MFMKAIPNCNNMVVGNTPPDSTTGPSSQPEDDTSEKVVHESSSTSDSERTESDTESGTPKGDKVQGEVVSSTVTSGVSIPVSDPEKAHVAQAGPHPEPMQEDQTGSDSGKLHGSPSCRPNPDTWSDEISSEQSLLTQQRSNKEKVDPDSAHLAQLYIMPKDDDQMFTRKPRESDVNICVQTTPIIHSPQPGSGTISDSDKERRIALSISKLKAARYLDFGLEELVPSLWVESEREYDISAVYGITHWWFRRKEFYINKHSMRPIGSEDDKRKKQRLHQRAIEKRLQTEDLSRSLGKPL
ncbi:hypothetical protein Tco_1455779 [Tanacetum coccineum]